MMPRPSLCPFCVDSLNPSSSCFSCSCFSCSCFSCSCFSCSWLPVGALQLLQPLAIDLRLPAPPRNSTKGQSLIQLFILVASPLRMDIQTESQLIAIQSTLFSGRNPANNDIRMRISAFKSRPHHPMTPLKRNSQSQSQIHLIHLQFINHPPPTPSPSPPISIFFHATLSTHAPI